MQVLKSNKVQSRTEFNGTPDRFITRKDNLTKDSYVKFNPFDGWVDYPIYFQLNEIDKSLLKKYNKKDFIYLYNPFYTHSDEMGITKYKVIGATMKKSDKRVLLIVEDLNPNRIFAYYYIQIENDIAIDCGNVFDKTNDNYNSVEIGEEYKGYRNSKWIKLNVNDYKSLFGKVYTSNRFIKDNQ